MRTDNGRAHRKVYYPCIQDKALYWTVSDQLNDPRLSVSTVAIIAQVIGGFIAGIGGASEIMSLYTNYRWVELTGFGWDGVTMAVFAKNNPRNVPIAALFIAYLRAGAYVMSIKTGIQVDLTKIVEAVIILFLLAEKFLAKTYRKMIIKEAEKERAAKQLAEEGK